MSRREIIKDSFSRLLSYMLVFSMLVCSLPFYINSVSSDEEYGLPWLWPVPGSYVITGLDYYYSGNPHGKGQAVDIGNNGYTDATRLDVVSATSGEVLYIQNSYNETTNRGSGWGNYVIVKSGDVCIIYAHLQKVTCKYGKISAGDVIGKMGNTGNSTGVHLHIQAYPYDQNSTSTDIHIFDKYIHNPLYVPYFRFRNGVIKYSERYGTHLATYYTSLSGTEHVFAGGYFGDYGEMTLGATVKSVRTNGARIYSQPITSSEQNDTVAFGKEITVYAYYYDAYGKLWYLVSENSLDKWIPESDVGFSSYTFGAQYEDKSSPNGTYGTYFDIYFAGKISVCNVIKSVKAEIRNDDGVVASFETNVNLPEYEINNAFSDGFSIIGLNDGEYTYEIFVTERASFPGADSISKTYSVFKSEFTIDKSASDDIPPLVEQIKILSITDTDIKLSVVATDNKAIQRLSFIFSNKSGFEESFDAVFDGNVFTAEIPISSLSGVGDYTVTARAYDPYMNEDESVLAVTIPSYTGTEKWKVQVSSSLTVRKGPGTNYGKATDSLKNNAIITVREVVYNSSDKRNWANIGSGWVALNYAVYQSGYLYKVTFNMLGGTADYSVLNKAFNQDATIPESKPTRNGYTFVGWASDPTATTPDYQPGDTYTNNESTVLYALWEDKVSPIITEVTLSNKEYVSDNVILSVNASDNSGTVFYSFDGGQSYRRANSLIISENQTIPAKTIVVKDPSGNVVTYDVDTIITNIDNVPPSIDDTTLNVTVDGENVTFTFDDAHDDLSGIEKYTLVYSVNSDFSGSVSEDVVSAHTVTLGKGVYYAKLVVYDKVGNKTEETFDRFLIGDPTQLSTPENFCIKSSSNEKVAFEWKSVNNADYYILTVSETPDFSSSHTVETAEDFMELSSLQNGKVYYAKLAAATYDGIYVASEATESIRFETVSSNNTIYSYDSINAAINGYEAYAKLPYSASSIDISCVVHDKATVKYFSDADLTEEISDPKSYVFTGDDVIVYVLVTAENGNKATHILKIVRAAKDADVPKVIFEASGETLYVGTFGKEIGLSASVNDEGTITAVWYYSFNGEDPVPFANGFTCTPRFVKPGNYKVYAVVTNTNTMCLNSVSTFVTSEADYKVIRNPAQIEVNISDFVYNGSTASASCTLYDGDADVIFKYYSDIGCENEIAAPQNAGTYYVKAFAAETDAYDAAESEAKQFVIKRKNNTNKLEYTVIQPTLRERFGKLSVLSNGVEYSLNGSEYIPIENGISNTFSEGDIINIRYSETLNVNASTPIEIRILPFSGTDDIYPSNDLDARVEGGYFIINTDSLSADELLDLLIMKDNIEVRDQDGVLMNGKSNLVYSGCVISIVDSIGVYKTLTVIVLGDADRDGIVSKDDAAFIMKLSNGMMTSKDSLDSVVCDLDGDGRITSIDAAKAYYKAK